MRLKLKSWHIAFLIFLFTLGGFFLARDIFAKIVWEKYGKADIALIFASGEKNLLMKLGSYYFGGGAYDIRKAKQAYEKAGLGNPPPLWSHYQLARLNFVEGNFNKALEEIDAELTYHPENFRSFYVRGLIYGYRGDEGDLKRSEDDFRRFIEKAPTEWAGYNDLAWVLSRAEKFDAVKEVVDLAFENVIQGKHNPWLLTLLGVAHLNLGEYKEAEAVLKEAKKYADSLTLEEWRLAYPGNDPVQAENGLREFQSAVEENVAKASTKLRPLP